MRIHFRTFLRISCHPAGEPETSEDIIKVIRYQIGSNGPPVDSPPTHDSFAHSQAGHVEKNGT